MTMLSMQENVQLKLLIRMRVENEFNHRSKYLKHKLSKLLDDFDESLIEVENMKNNGYRQIFDCGNLVFTKNYI